MSSSLFFKCKTLFRLWNWKFDTRHGLFWVRRGQGRMQPVSLGGAISVTFGSQVSLLGQVFATFATFFYSFQQLPKYSKYM